MSAELRWPAAKVRATFVDFFKNHAGHTFVPSSPVVPLTDATLLFANSGMVQYKPIFLGTVDPNTDFGKLKRAANSQLCIRAGGKHNDLDDVGKDTYHHTFFEMLGSWSFGDYFKKDAIDWAWHLLTDVFGIEKDRLYVTYFEGSEKLGLPEDLETKELWLRHVKEDHILKGNAKDNFWEMGDTGPCGPCTEIHYDRVGGRNAAHLVNKDDPLVLEIWNLVFMQFNRGVKDGPLTRLPACHVDTGMGFERLVSVLQNKLSNYDTDLWEPMFTAIQKVCKYPHSYYDKECPEDAIVAYRVVADHARCLTVALSDGAVPDNQGRGFVLRRIIRRAVRYGNQFLGAETGFFTQLASTVGEILGGFFPQLADPNTQRRVQTILKEEEESFARTWRVGLKHFDTALQTAKAANKTEIAPEDAFVLHDRYGFPVDLTTLLAEREGFTVDAEAFKAEMKKNQVSGGRVAAAKTFFDTYQVDELNRRGIAPTVDTAKYTWENAEATVVAIFDKTKGAFVDEAPRNDDPETVGIVCDVSNFYAESGGQIFDQGSIITEGGSFEVKKCYAFGGFVVHIGDLTRGEVKVGAKVNLNVDYERRQPIAVNHTSTHVLNQVLREVLQFGHPETFTEVNQRGSLVTEDYLRFDFSWNSKLTPADIEKTEELLNKAIAAKLPVHSRLVPLADASNIAYIRRMFDEKYPDPCTVVCVGKSIEELLANPKNEEWRNYSIELCGGTHIPNFEQVKRAVVISEDALTKGVRRMTIYTRDSAAKALELGNQLRAQFDAICARKDLDFDDKSKALSVLNKEVGETDTPLLQKLKLRGDIEVAIKALLVDKKAALTQQKAAAAAYGKALAEAQRHFAVLRLDQMTERESIAAAVEAYMAVHPAVGVLALGVDAPKGKAMAIAALPAGLVSQGVSAVEWVSAACFGKGGGKPNNAQTGVAADKADEVLKAAWDAAIKFTAKLTPAAAAAAHVDPAQK